MGTVLSIIKSRQDFLKTQKSPVKWISQGFVVHTSACSDCVDSGIRFGFTISKKSVSRAVDRNKIKRRLRHIARDFIHDCTGKGSVWQDKCDGRDIVVVVRHKCLDMTYQDMRDQFRWCMKHLARKL